MFYNTRKLYFVADNNLFKSFKLDVFIIYFIKTYVVSFFFYSIECLFLPFPVMP